MKKYFSTLKKISQYLYGLVSYMLWAALLASCLFIYEQVRAQTGGIEAVSPENIPARSLSSESSSIIVLSSSSESSSSSSESSSCPFYKFEAKALNGRGLVDDIFVRGDYQLQCLEDEFTKAYNYCTAAMAALNPSGEDDTVGVNLDDCIVDSYFIKRGNPSSIAGTYAPYFQANPITSQWTPTQVYTSTITTTAGIRTPASNATFYLKENADGTCTALSEDPEDLSGVCDLGTMQYKVTPLSLLWDMSLDIDNTPSFVNFPLDIAMSKPWYVWKASAKAPLLVYDPTHEGKITSATQLFGEWTFGGKRFASLDERNSSIAGYKWKDGYEALSTLDRNGDKRLDGEEIEKLALWFDDNRDGISQKGEVKTLAESGVTVIYYSPNRKDEASGNIYADLGYERVIDGKVVTGASVDWFAEGLNSKYDLLSQALASSSTCLPVAKSAIESENVVVGSQANSEQQDFDDLLEAKNKESDSKSLSGAWLWTIKDKQQFLSDKPPQGYFVFNEMKDGTFVGHSFGESSFSKNKTNTLNRVDIFSLKGKKENKFNETSLQFILSNSSSLTSSEASLSVDGMILSGRTTAEVPYQGKRIKVTYSWEAKRILPKSLK